MRYIIIRLIKFQASNTAKVILAQHYNSDKVNEIIKSFWLKYLNLRQKAPKMETFGGFLMIHLAIMSTAFYQELILRGNSAKTATTIFYDVAWKIYRKMGAFSWWLAGLNNKKNIDRLSKATNLFRAFPFNSPCYQWKDVPTATNVIGFDCLKCPVAEYFKTQNLSEFCSQTWCALDFPLAEMWGATLERSGSIASGAGKCDFRWIVKSDYLDV